MQVSIQQGNPTPLGLTSQSDGLNFALYSKSGQKVQLCLLDPDSLENLGKYDLCKTGNIWHLLVKNPPKAFAYYYEIDSVKVLDPYAQKVKSTFPWGSRLEPYQPLGFYETEETFDWESDAPPSIPVKELILYEAHVRGFTNDPSSQEPYPGSYLAMIHKLPYLKNLGINAIELLPIFEFNECENQNKNPSTGERLTNYWGYSTVHFFSPMNRYASEKKTGQANRELKMLVKAAHSLGIEVILDVVFNHTAEGNEKGPIYSFKGIDCPTYYILDKQGHTNYTGCGNTVNANHPVTKQWILDCLRYWVLEYRIDGFRFDLASALTRDPKGIPLLNAPLIEDITHDPLLAQVKLIAEPWDAGGLYQVGSFYPSEVRWLEWNGKYRDVVRRFIAGFPFHKGSFATCLCGSQDLYANRSPTSSQNFITVHDGFTLHDLVSYSEKHNENNGENNRDGNSSNESWNCGVEGPTTNKKILSLREQQMKNLHLALMISQGVPILLMGDEYGHTKFGNNNTWCQDNPLNWFQWDLLEENKEFYRFYKSLIHFRKKHSVLRKGTFLTSEDIQWHGLRPHHPNWDEDNHFLAFTLFDHETRNCLYIAFNCSPQHYQVEFPPSPAPREWRWIVNTACESPQDFYDDKEAPLVKSLIYQMPRHSSLILKTFI